MDRHLSRSRWPFWGPLAAILGFADCAALQAVNECPRLVFISIPPQGGGGTRVSYNVQSFVVFFKASLHKIYQVSSLIVPSIARPRKYFLS